MITIKNIPNVFEPKHQEVQKVSYQTGLTLEKCLRHSEWDVKDCHVSVDGNLIQDLDILLKDGQEVFVSPKVEGPVIAGAVAGFFGALTGASSLFLYNAIVFAGKVLAVASLALSIYSVFQKPRKPSFSIGEGLDESSPTYNWDGMITQYGVGQPIPLVYGEHQVSGHVINFYTDTDGDKHYLNLLLLLSQGEVESIDSIKINDQPAENFDSITLDKRYGSDSQSVIPNFDDQHNVQTVNVTLPQNNSHVYTTVDNDVEGFDLIFNFTSIFEQEDSGNIKAWEMSYTVEYKLNSAGTWTSLGTQTVNYKSQSPIKRIFSKRGLSAEKYDIRVTKVSADADIADGTFGDLVWFQTDEIKTDDLVYNNRALLGIRALATEQLSGSAPDVKCIVKGRKVSVPKVMNGGQETGWEDYYWDSNTEQYKLLSDDTVLSWDGTSYVHRYSANPVWCIKDLLTNRRYGLGDFTSYEDIDETLFLEMSRYCEEKVSDLNGGYCKRYRLDIVIDSETAVVDLLNQLSAVFRGLIYFSEGKIKMTIDKPADLDSEIAQQFGMGNIIKESGGNSIEDVSIQRTSVKESPNQITVQYLNKDNSYKNEILKIQDEELQPSDPIRNMDVRLFVTDTRQALTLGKYALLAGKHLKEVITFTGNIQALHCEAGDLIAFSHDVPQIGFSGVAVAGTSNSITLDRSIVIEEGKSYEIQVFYADSSYETKTITNSAGTYTVLNASGSFSQVPQHFTTKYSFGETGISTKPYRIVSLERDGLDRFRITALEYNAGIYDEEGLVLPDFSYSVLNFDIPDVSNLTLSERLFIAKDGTVKNAIDVSFQKPDPVSGSVRRFEKAKIYISDDGAKSFSLAGETYGDSFTVDSDIADGAVYNVAVVSVSMDGESKTVLSSPQATIVVFGKSLPPADVSNFSVVFSNNKLVFRWDKVSDLDLKGYEIRELPFSGASWDLGTVLETNITETMFIWNFLTAGTRHYAIKALDTSGNYSLVAAVDSIVVSSIPAQNIIENHVFDLKSGDINASIERTWRKSYSSEYYRLALSLATQRRWDDGIWDEENVYFDKPVTGVEGEYITQVVDLGGVFTVDILLSLGLENEKSGAMDVFVAFSDTDPDLENWVFFSNGSYTGRYFRFRIVLRTADTNYGVHLYSMAAFFDLPDKEQEGNQVTVADSGWTTISLNGFTDVKTIIVSSDGDPYLPKIDQTDSPESFKVQLFDSGIQKAGKVNYYVKGY